MSRLMSVPTEVKLKIRKQSELDRMKKRKLRTCKVKNQLGTSRVVFQKFGDIVDSVSSDHPAALAGLMVLNFVTSNDLHHSTMNVNVKHYKLYNETTLRVTLPPTLKKKKG